MDELARQLKQDAEAIDVAVSPALERRIRASLQSVTPETTRGWRTEQTRPYGFWWASSLTGVAAAAAVILIINSQREAPPPQATPASVVAAVPVIDWKTETAMLTGQLEKELDALQSDIRKAEDKVRKEIGL